MSEEELPSRQPQQLETQQTISHSQPEIEKEKRTLPVWMTITGLRTRCGRCHYYRQDMMYIKRFRNRNGKWISRHICPETRVDGCPGYHICGYERGHIVEIRQQRKEKRLEAKRKRDLEKEMTKKRRVETALTKAEKKKKLAEEKQKRKEKHLFGRCSSLSTYLDKLGVKET